MLRDLLRPLAEMYVEIIEGSPEQLPWLLLWLGAAMLPVVLIHEIGHAVVAAVRNQEDIELVVGNRGSAIRGRVLGVDVAARGAVPWDALGAVTFSAARATAMDILVISLAGPGASIVTGTALLGIYAVMPEIPWVHNFVGTTGLASFIVGLPCLVPIRYPTGVPFRKMRLSETDGKQALDALIYLIRRAR